MIAAFFGFLYALILQYLIPFIVALGVIMFLYGCINYFVIGPGEEPTREEGRHQLLWALIAFLLGLAIYAALATLGWIGGWTTSLYSDVNVGEETRLQQVPDVPLENN